jgi:hypothetical protein
MQEGFRRVRVGDHARSATVRREDGDLQFTGLIERMGSHHALRGIRQRLSQPSSRAVLPPTRRIMVYR